MVSDKAKDHFDFVIDDDLIYNLPNSPDRWPDKGNGARKDPKDAPPIKRVSLDRVFIATQGYVGPSTVENYIEALKRGASMPPVAAIKCKDGIIVWNGHHRLAAHRAAGRKTIKVRYWAEVDDTFTDKAEA